MPGAFCLYKIDLNDLRKVELFCALSVYVTNWIYKKEIKCQMLNFKSMNNLIKFLSNSLNNVIRRSHTTILTKFL